MQSRLKVPDSDAELSDDPLAIGRNKSTKEVNCKRITRGSRVRSHVADELGKNELSDDPLAIGRNTTKEVNRKRITRGSRVRSHVADDRVTSHVADELGKDELSDDPLVIGSNKSVKKVNPAKIVRSSQVGKQLVYKPKAP
ncbi:hypothetical protein PSHT_01297 [Puccinia striiformis]|uniref:Uncharacterized protein n=1 Tax=Puccinia striiformis TaxID=27350 RepID=A0A2S4WKX4_9BASI|nr:hypothetical protein PSHT_01297 [Puccinia striiformis]